MLAWLALSSLTGMVHAGNPGVGTSVTSPDGGSYDHREMAVDMRVKVIGGDVRVRRHWNAGEWEFFPAWVDLAPATGGQRIEDGFDALPPGDEPDEIVRGELTYERVADTEPPRWEQHPVRYVEATDTGYRWGHREGNWIEYDDQGRMVAFGNRNDVRVTVERDAEDRIERVIDHNGNTVLDAEYDGQGRLIRIVDRAGREVRYNWSGSDLQEVVDVRGERWRYEYEAIAGQQRLTASIDPDGRSTEYHYAELEGGIECVPTGSGTWQQDSAGEMRWTGQCVEQSVSEQGYLRAVSDALGIRARYQHAYDEGDETFIRATERDGALTTRVLDTEGRVIKHRVGGRVTERWEYGGNFRTRIDARGNETREELNRYDEVVRIEYPDGGVERFEYNDYGAVKRHVDETGTVTEHTYDDNGNPSRTVEAVGSAVERVIEFEYDAYGQRTLRRLVGDSATPAGEVHWTHDAHGNIQTRTDELGHVDQYAEHNVRGDPAVWIDRDGEQWEIEHDAAGNVLSVADPDGHQTTREYDGAGNLIAEVNRLGHRVEWAIGDAGEVVAISGSAVVDHSFFYDSHGRLHAIEDADGVREEIRYNEAGLVDRVIDGAGIEETFVYGTGAGNVGPMQVARIERPRSTVRVNYDGRGRVIRVAEEGDGGSRAEVRRTYDQVGRATRIVDQAGKGIDIEYDALGRTRRITNAVGDVVNFGHDARGNVVAVDNERNVRIRTYEYDARGDLTRIETPDGGARDLVRDANRRVIEQIDPEGRIARLQYNPAGHLTGASYFATRADVDAGVAGHSTTLEVDAGGRVIGYQDGGMSASYSRNDQGRITQATVDFGELQAGYQQSFTPGGRLAQRSIPGVGQVIHERDSAGRVQLIRHPDGSRMSFGYDAVTGLSSELLLPGGSRREAEHDGLGRITRLSARDPAGNLIDQREYAYSEAGHVTSVSTLDGAHVYGYDTLGRLTSAVHPGREDEHYTYDPTGNRLSSADTEGTWAYNNSNQLLGHDEATFEYDASGALVQRADASGTTHYDYDLRERLASVDHADGNSAEYAHDPLGRRVGKSVDGEATYFLYTEDGLLAEIAADGSVERGYGWAPGSLWGTDPLWLRDGDQTYYYLTDHLGTPHKLINQGGSTVWEGQYSAFGQVSQIEYSVPNPLRMGGQYADDESGMYQNWQRYYLPDAGRYAQSDPIDILDGLNTYLYARNDPLTHVDPYGEFASSPGTNDGSRSGPDSAPSGGDRVSRGGAQAAVNSVWSGGQELRSGGSARDALDVGLETGAGAIASELVGLTPFGRVGTCLVGAYRCAPGQESCEDLIWEAAKCCALFQIPGVRTAGGGFTRRAGEAAVDRGIFEVVGGRADAARDSLLD